MGQRRVNAAAIKDEEDAFLDDEELQLAAHDELDPEDSNLSADALAEKIIREAKVPAAITIANLAVHAKADGVRLAAAKFVLEHDRKKGGDDDYWDDALKRLSQPPKEDKKTES